MRLSTIYYTKFFFLLSTSSVCVILFGVSLRRQFFLGKVWTRDAIKALKRAKYLYKWQNIYMTIMFYM